MMLLATLFSLVLAVAPGAWIAFTLLDRSVAFSIRFATAIALSPFVVGAQILALTALGLSFEIAAAATVLNAAAFVLMRPEGPIAPFVRSQLLDKRFIAPVGCFLVMAAGLVALWTFAPNFRVYSWHHMMQAEAVYQVAQLPALPEEMGLAGVRMHYPWFGHIQIAGVARLADISPFLAFPVFNLAALLALFMLMLDAVLLMKPARLATAAFAATAVLLSTNLAGVLASYIMSFYSMDLRLSTPVHKFLHFDLMTTGLALFMAVLALALIGISQFRWRRWIALLLCLAALAFIYPLLLPSALVVAGAALAVPHALGWLNGGRLWPTLEATLAGIALALPLAALAVNLALLSNVDTATPVALAGPAAIKQSLGAGLFAAIAWVPFLIPALFALWRTREPKRLTLVFAAAVSAALFVGTSMPATVNYKFLVAALLCLLPIVAEQLITWLERRPKLEVPIAAAAAAAVCLAIGPHIAREHVPWGLLNTAAPIAEQGFVIAPAEAERFAWMTAIRDRAPRNSIILHPLQSTPVEVFAQRPSYVLPDDDAAPRPGYTMTAQTILEEVKGYPHDLVTPRENTLATAYSNDPDANYNDVTVALLTLGRPVAVYLPLGAAYLEWLETNGPGAALYADDDAVVWLITVPSA